MAVLLCLSCMQRHKELEEEKKRVGVYALHFPYACRPASPASPPLLLQLHRVTMQGYHAGLIHLTVPYALCKAL